MLSDYWRRINSVKLWQISSDSWQSQRNRIPKRLWRLNRPNWSIHGRSPNYEHCTRRLRLHTLNYSTGSPCSRSGSPNISSCLTITLHAKHRSACVPLSYRRRLKRCRCTKLLCQIGQKHSQTRPKIPRPLPLSVPIFAVWNN